MEAGGKDMTDDKYRIGCCEMETDKWACGTIDVLTVAHVCPDDGGYAEYRYVCEQCAKQYGVA